MRHSEILYSSALNAERMARRRCRGMAIHREPQILSGSTIAVHMACGILDGWGTDQATHPPFGAREGGEGRLTPPKTSMVSNLIVFIASHPHGARQRAGHASQAEPTRWCFPPLGLHLRRARTDRENRKNRIWFMIERYLSLNISPFTYCVDHAS